MTDKFVFDTNSLISAALLPKSVNGQAIRHALSKGRIAVSEATLEEFVEVIFRKKSDKYFINDSERLEAISRIEKNSLAYFPKTKINACRDPKDNKFLELAVAAKATCIITGDQDLWVLHPFYEITIVNAADFLTHF